MYATDQCKGRHASRGPSLVLSITLMPVRTHVLQQLHHFAVKHCWQPSVGIEDRYA